MPTASVKALRPESRNGFRVVLAQEWFRERFWVVPAALLVAGMAVGIAVSRADSIPGLVKVGGGLPVRASSAESLLGIIAASMLTFVGVVFTITLVALQLASAQLSPRVIRTFVRSGITKLAFGLFLATFAYAIVVIVVEGASSRPDVLRLAVTLGVLFVLTSLVVFVVYVTAIMRLLQVSWVVTAVAEETRRALSTNRPVDASYRSAAAPHVDQDPRLVRLREERNDGSRGQFVYVDLPLATHYLWVTKRLVKGLFVDPVGWPERSPLWRGSMNSYRDPSLDRQTVNGPFDHGFFFDSAIAPRGGSAPYLH